MTEIKLKQPRGYMTPSQTYPERATLLFDPNLSDKDRNMITSTRFWYDTQIVGSRRWIDDEDHAIPVVIGGVMATAGYWIAAGISYIHYSWERGAVAALLYGAVVGYLTWFLGIRKTPNMRGNERVNKLTGKFLVLPQDRAGGMYEELLDAYNPIFATRAYKEGWVDKPKVKMIVDEEAWRILQRLRTVTDVTGSGTLTVAQKQSTDLVRAKIDERIAALHNYYQALLDIDARLVEADMLKDRERANGTIVDLLAELEGDRAIALTKALTEEAEAVQQAIAEAISQARLAATEIHALHAPKE